MEEKISLLRSPESSPTCDMKASTGITNEDDRLSRNDLTPQEERSNVFCKEFHKDSLHPVIRGEGDGCDIDDGDGKFLFCIGFERSYYNSFLFHLLAVLSVGFLYLVCYWKSIWGLYLTHKKAPLSRATKVLISDPDGRQWVEDVKFLDDVGLESLASFNAKDNEAYDAEVKHSKQLSGSVRKRVPEQRSEIIDDIFTDQTPFDGKTTESRRYFIHKELRYLLYGDKFELLKGYEGTSSLRFISRQRHGLSLEDESKRQKIFGKNIIDVHVKSYSSLFIEESADPFYVFQIFSCILWFSDEYYYYAASILLISIVSICISISQTKKHLTSLKNMIATSDPVAVLRPSGNEETISSEELVVGDVLVIPGRGCNMHCDAVLVSGTAIVNESSLTGESVPVTKVAIPYFDANPQSVAGQEILTSLKHKRNILFCGTKVLQTRFYGDARVLAVVYNTGFHTLKGNLIRSILYPKPMDFKFFLDALKFVFVLVVFALIGLCYTAYIFYRDGARIKEIILRALDVITIAVPPALPAAMSVGVVYALGRLKLEDIYCISPSRIDIAGKIKLFCFDKTGTLTEEGLDFYGVIEVTNQHFLPFTTCIDDVRSNNFVVGIASCHSLTQIDGKLCGNPLDLKMFEASGWELDEVGIETERYETVAPTIVRPKGVPDAVSVESLLSGHPPLEVAMLKQYPFSSDLQRMSVIVRTLGASQMDVYCKGSPEMITSLCTPETVPRDFEEHLCKYTANGYRVLALAYKSLSPKILWHQAQHFTRDQVELDLTFLGLVVLKNTLKPETMPVIKQLHSADIRVVMATGDNLLTAVSVARECAIVEPYRKVIWVNMPDKDNQLEQDLQYTSIGELDTDAMSTSSQQSLFHQNYHFAMTGKTFGIIRSNFSTLYERLLLCTTVFARMLPDQKAQLVEDLQKLGYGVGMCGDGANDCGALKVAHCGISLSEAEASVASPFTSKVPNIECVIKVLREGRCALVTSFSVFKYMALYSMVQYSSVLMLYYVESNLGNFQYLYVDLVLILPIAITMSRTGPYPNLVKQRPLGSLIHPLVLFSLITQIVIQFGFQIGTWFYLHSLPGYKDANWFRENLPKHDDTRTQITCYENTGLFCISCFQYMLLAIAFATGKPYRKPAYTNIAMIASILILLSVTVAFTNLTGHFLPMVFELVEIEDKNFVITMLEFAAMNALLSWSLEFFIVPSTCLRIILDKLRRKKKHKNKYKNILAEMEKNVQWPPYQILDGV